MLLALTLKPRNTRHVSLPVAVRDRTHPTADDGHPGCPGWPWLALALLALNTSGTPGRRRPARTDPSGNPICMRPAANIPVFKASLHDHLSSARIRGGAPIQTLSGGIVSTALSVSLDKAPCVARRPAGGGSRIICCLPRLTAPPFHEARGDGGPVGEPHGEALQLLWKLRGLAVNASLLRVKGERTDTDFTLSPLPQTRSGRQLLQRHAVARGGQRSRGGHPWLRQSQPPGLGGEGAAGPFRTGQGSTTSADKGGGRRAVKREAE